MGSGPAWSESRRPRREDPLLSARAQPQDRARHGQAAAQNRSEPRAPSSREESTVARSRAGPRRVTTETASQNRPRRQDRRVRRRERQPTTGARTPRSGTRPRGLFLSHQLDAVLAQHGSCLCCTCSKENRCCSSASASSSITRTDPGRRTKAERGDGPDGSVRFSRRNDGRRAAPGVKARNFTLSRARPLAATPGRSLGGFLLPPPEGR